MSPEFIVPGAVVVVVLVLGFIAYKKGLFTKAEVAVQTEATALRSDVTTAVADLKQHITNAVAAPVVVNVHPAPAPAPVAAPAPAPEVLLGGSNAPPKPIVTADPGSPSLSVYDFLGGKKPETVPVPVPVESRDPSKTTPAEFGSGEWLRVNGSAVLTEVPLHAGHYTVNVEPQASSVQGSVAFDGQTAQFSRAFTVDKDTTGTVTAQGAGNIQLNKLAVVTGTPGTIHIPIK